MDIDAIGDSIAPPFEAFYIRQRDPIVRALALTLGDAALAGEACDEAMLRAYQRWGRIGRYDNPAGWVYRVGLNWSRSWIRKRSRIELGGSVDGVVVPELRDPVLERAVAQLSVKLRSVVVLRYYLDWSTEQTATALGVAEGTVKSRLSRALDRLAEDLGSGEAQ